MLPALAALLALLLLPGGALVAAPWPAVPLLSATFWLCSWGLTDLLGLSREAALAMKYRSFGSAEQLRAALIDAIATRALLGDDDTPRDAKAFNKQKERAKPRIAVVKQALLRDVAEILSARAGGGAAERQAAVHRRDAR